MIRKIETKDALKYIKESELDCILIKGVGYMFVSPTMKPSWFKHIGNRLAEEKEAKNI